LAERAERAFEVTGFTVDVEGTETDVASRKCVGHHLADVGEEFA
jgi:hypothetical protein